MIVAFDVTNYDSFLKVNHWLNEIKGNSSNDVVTLIIGNKIDLDDKRVVFTEEARSFANSLGINYIETSAKTAVGVEESFNKLVEDIRSKIVPSPEPKIDAGADQKKKAEECIIS